MTHGNEEPTAVVWLRRADFDLLIFGLDYIAENVGPNLDAETATRFGEIYENLTDSRDRFDGAIAAAPQPVEKPKRKRRTKAEIEAEKAAAAEPQTIEEQTVADELADATAKLDALGTPVSQQELVEMTIDAALANPGSASFVVPSVPQTGAGNER